MNDSDLVTIYTGPVVEAEFLKSYLVENQVSVFVRNDLQSGLAAGFGAATPGTAMRLMVHEEDTERAKQLIDEYQKHN